MSSAFVEQVGKIADTYQGKGKPKMTSPIQIAGLSDMLKNATAGMARAAAAAQAINTSTSRLVGNITQVESITSQLDEANKELEGAISAVGGPLPEPAPGNVGSGSGTTVSPGSGTQGVTEAPHVQAAAIPAVHDAAPANPHPQASSTSFPAAQARPTQAGTPQAQAANVVADHNATPAPAATIAAVHAETAAAPKA